VLAWTIKINGRAHNGAPTYTPEEGEAAIKAAFADWTRVREQVERLEKERKRLEAETKRIESELEELSPRWDRLWPERDLLTARRDQLKAEISRVEAEAQRVKADWERRHGVAVVYRPKEPHIVVWTPDGELLGPVAEGW